MNDYEGVFQVAWSPDGAKLATTGVKGDNILIWDLATKTVLKTIDKLPERFGWGFLGWGYRVAWLPESDALWVKMDGSIIRIDLTTGKSLSPENGRGTDLFLSPNGRRLLVSSHHTFMYRGDDASFFPCNFLGWLDASWMPDSRRALIGGTGYDIDRRRRLGTLFPHNIGGNSDHWLCIGPDGHYRGSLGIEHHIVYVCQTDAGEHLTLSLAEFQKRFGWKNDPSKARLLAWE